MALKKASSAEKESTGADKNQSDNGALLAPEHDTIARRAYELYCAWGFEDGNDLAHWFEAERQLTAEIANQTANKDELLGMEAAG